VVPAPHTVKQHGTSDLHIGPHVFHSTNILEVHYTPQYSSYGTSFTPRSSNQLAQDTPLAATNPLVTITPDLLARVTRAGASNPTLGNLLQLAASGHASQDQLRTLGLLIQTLEASHTQDLPPFSSGSTTSQEHYPHQSIPKYQPPDLVLEFLEKPSLRFIFPRGLVYYELVNSSQYGHKPDLILTTCLPPKPVDLSFSETSAAGSSFSSPVVAFRFTNVPISLWDFIQTWAGGPSALAESKRILERKVRLRNSKVCLSLT
jgi:hypothetical protein